jgi:hypothetical protein
MISAMKRLSRRIRLAAIISFLIVFTLFSQYDSSAKNISPLDCPVIENSGENDPLADLQDMEGLFASFPSQETSFVEVTAAAHVLQRQAQTPPYRQISFLLRC